MLELDRILLYLDIFFQIPFLLHIGNQCPEIWMKNHGRDTILPWINPETNPKEDPVPDLVKKMNINPEEISPRGVVLQKVKTTDVKIKTRQSEDTILRPRKRISVNMTTTAIDPKEMKIKMIYQQEEEKVRYPKEIFEKEVLKTAIMIGAEDKPAMIAMTIPNPGKDLAEMKKKGGQRNPLSHQEDAKDTIRLTTMTR